MQFTSNRTLFLLCRMCEICGQTAKNITGVRDNRFIEDWHEQGSTSGVDFISSNQGTGCWHGQPFCNFLVVCLVISFVLPWFFHVNMFQYHYCRRFLKRLLLRNSGAYEITRQSSPCYYIGCVRFSMHIQTKSSLASSCSVTDRSAYQSKLLDFSYRGINSHCIHLNVNHKFGQNTDFILKLIALQLLYIFGYELFFIAFFSPWGVAILESLSSAQFGSVRFNEIPFGYYGSIRHVKVTPN